jgi:hypothetical protein
MYQSTLASQLSTLDLTVRIKASDENFEEMYLLQTMIAAYTNPQAHYDLHQNGMPEPERRAEIAILGAMFEELMH